MSKREFNMYILLLCLVLLIFDFTYLAGIIGIVTIIFNLLEVK